MPPRDEQGFEGRRQQIIDGALQVFASKGFDSATNKDIAAASGIGSPGLIYHYFKDKYDLLQQVVEQRMPLLQLLTHSEEEMMSKSPEEMLTIFGKAFLGALDNPKSLPVMKLLISEAFRQPIFAEMFNTIGPSHNIAFLTRYLEKQMADGFIGLMIAYMITREVFIQPDAQQISTDMMIETTVKVFLQGMEICEPSVISYQHV